MNATPIRCALLVVFTAWAPSAWADIAGPEPVDVDETSLCDPDQEEGDSCETEDGEEGTCSGEAESCYDPSKASYTKCQVCDEDCSVGPGPRPGSGPGALVGLGALGLALLGGRRMARRRRTGR